MTWDNIFPITYRDKRVTPCWYAIILEGQFLRYSFGFDQLESTVNGSMYQFKTLFVFLRHPTIVYTFMIKLSAG